MRAPAAARLSVALVLVTGGCEEVRVRPDLSELADESTTAETEEAPPLGDLDLPEPLRPIALAAGYYNTCAVLGDGRVACFGDNRAAFGSEEQDGDLTVIDGFAAEQGLALSQHHACAWSDGEALTCWPRRYGGGNRPQGVGLPHVTEASLGGEHLCALLTDGHVRCIWDDRWGQSASPFRSHDWWVPGVADVAEVATGATHTCARHRDGRVTCWGDNRRGQMGGASERSRAVPQLVPAIEGVTQIASHDLAVQTCALGGEGAISCWGSYGVERAGGTTPLGGTHETLPPIEGERAILDWRRAMGGLRRHRRRARPLLPAEPCVRARRRGPGLRRGRTGGGHRGCASGRGRRHARLRPPRRRRRGLLGREHPRSARGRNEGGSPQAGARHRAPAIGGLGE